MQANSTREIVKVRDRLEAWRETAQRAANYAEDYATPGDYKRAGEIRTRNQNLAANYGALIAQLDAVIQAETQPLTLDA